MLRSLSLSFCLFACPVLAFAQAEPDAAFKSDCNFRLKPTDIRVKVVAPAPDYDYSKTMAQLTAMHPSRGTMGLTAGERLLQLKSDGAVWRRSDGMGCTRPVFEMTVTLKLTVYVAKEFPSGTCTYREIKEHEQRHVRANREYAEAAARNVEAEMRKAFGNDIYYGPASSLVRDLEKSVRDGWFKHLKTSLEGVKSWHAKIDSPAEYERPYIACKGEPSRLIEAAGKNRS